MTKFFWIISGLILLIISLIKSNLFQTSNVYAQYPGTACGRIFADNNLDCNWDNGIDTGIYPYVITIAQTDVPTNSGGRACKAVNGGWRWVSVVIPGGYGLRTDCSGVENPIRLYINGDTQNARFPLILFTPTPTPTPTPTNTPTPTPTPTNTPTPTPTPTPTNTPTPTPTPTPFQTVRFRNPQLAPYGQNVCNAAWNCGTTTGTTDGCAVRSDYTVAILQTNTCSGVRTPSYIYADLLGITPAPTSGYQSVSDSNNSFYGWPVWYTGENTATFVWAYNIYGWVYNEANNNPPTREGSETLLANYTLNLSGDKIGSTLSLGSVVNELNANYIFNKIQDGNYYVALAVTPTGYKLASGYTNPRAVGIAGGPKDIHFPFVTVTPSPGEGTPTATPPVVIPSLTPTGTPSPTVTTGPSPTLTPTPTSLLAPTSTVMPGTPTPTGGISCQSFPTPILGGPAHELCTNVKPTFAATVNNPNNDSSWATFYSNAYETFSGGGTVQLPPGGDSTWIPDESVLNSTGGYWWTAYTESPSCARSIDAPSRLLNMDYQSPPAPTPPTCTLTGQSWVTGICTFNCSWPANPEPTDPVTQSSSCSNTSDYHPIFWTSPGPGSWDPGWIGNELSRTVTTSDGQELYGQLEAKDGLNNTSSPSVFGGPFTCPGIEFSASPTPGGPSITPSVTPTPTLTPTPTITLTPTPGAWIQVQEGDLYMSSAPNNIPSGQSLLTGGGVMWFKSGSYTGLSSPNWGIVDNNGLTNTYNFTYYLDALKSKAKTVSNQNIGIVDNGDNLDQTNAIYSYSGLGYYQLSTSFNGRITSGADVTIFLITGSLDITQNFALTDSNDTVVFIVNGNIFVNGNVTVLEGLYFSSQTFTIASGTSPITINGMVYANTLNLNPGRSYRNVSNPTYKFIFQPKYMIALLPYLGRASVNWQEVQQ